MPTSASKKTLSDYIQYRIDNAPKWRSRLNELKNLAKNGRYVRLNGDGFRAISITDENSCGSLYISENARVTAKKDIGEAFRLGISANHIRIPKNKKGEHKIQAHIIRHAMESGLSFKGLFSGFDEIFDDIIFICDEFSAITDDMRIRADIIALGKKGNDYYPIFIELKNRRSLKELGGQLKDASTLLRGDSRPLFIKYLRAIAGVPESAKIHDNAEDCKVMIIWPNLVSGKNLHTVDNFANQPNHYIAEFGNNLKKDWEFTRFVPKPSK